MEYRLLEKTELWIKPLQLKEANLDACAKATGDILGLTPQEIMVTDAQQNHLAFDILKPVVDASMIVARKDALLAALGAVPGVELNDETDVHSDGILGMISLDAQQGREVLERTRQVRDQLVKRLARRAKVFPTGSEVINGQIKDTNTPFLMEKLNTLGFSSASATPLPDHTNAISVALRQAVEDGYGLIITTGGVGAEGKDKSVEALLHLDPDAATPYYLKFTRGQGRHAKEGVRIGVGRLARSMLIALPGPHDEICLVWPVLEQGLAENWSKTRLATHLAEALRGKFLARQDHNCQLYNH